MSPKLISSIEDIRSNIEQLAIYEAGNKKEREFHHSLIKKGKNFIAFHTEGDIKFGPSRFAGYLGNTLKSMKKSAVIVAAMVAAPIKLLIKSSVKSLNMKMLKTPILSISFLPTAKNTK